MTGKLFDYRPEPEKPTAAPGNAPDPEPPERPTEQTAGPWDLSGGVDEAVMVRINPDVHRRATGRPGMPAGNWRT